MTVADEERSALVDEIIAALDARGAPPDVWLVEIAQVRQALRTADTLLLRMQDAITTHAAQSTEPM